MNLLVLLTIGACIKTARVEGLVAKKGNALLMKPQHEPKAAIKRDTWAKKPDNFRTDQRHSPGQSLWSVTSLENPTPSSENHEVMKAMVRLSNWTLLTWTISTTPQYSAGVVDNRQPRRSSGSNRDRTGNERDSTQTGYQWNLQKLISMIRKNSKVDGCGKTHDGPAINVLKDNFKMKIRLLDGLRSNGGNGPRDSEVAAEHATLDGGSFEASHDSNFDEFYEKEDKLSDREKTNEGRTFSSSVTQTKISISSTHSATKALKWDVRASEWIFLIGIVCLIGVGFVCLSRQTKRIASQRSALVALPSTSNSNSRMLPLRHQVCQTHVEQEAIMHMLLGSRGQDWSRLSLIDQVMLQRTQSTEISAWRTVTNETDDPPTYAQAVTAINTWLTTETPPPYHELAVDTLTTTVPRNA